MITRRFLPAGSATVDTDVSVMHGLGRRTQHIGRRRVWSMGWGGTFTAASVAQPQGCKSGGVAHSCRCYTITGFGFRSLAPSVHRVQKSRRHGAARPPASSVSSAPPERLVLVSVSLKFLSVPLHSCRRFLRHRSDAP